MPIGGSINANPPLLTDSSAVAMGKLVDTLSRLIVAVEGRVPAGAVDFFGSPLDLQGSAILEAGYLTMLSQVTDPGGGSITGVMYNKAGNLWYVDGDGSAIQITASGTLNAAAIGGIVGDYGGANPAKVTFVDATGDYEFTTDPTVFADIRVATVKLKTGASTEVTLAGASGQSGLATFPQHPGSLSLVAINGSGQFVYSNNQAVSATFSDVTVTGGFHHPQRRLMFKAGGYASVNVTQVNGNFGHAGAERSYFDLSAASTATPGRVEIPLQFLEYGSVVKKVGFRLELAPPAGASGTISVSLVRYNQATYVYTILSSASFAFTPSSTSGFYNVDSGVITQSLDDNSQYTYSLMVSAGGTAARPHNVDQVFIEYLR